jgi:PAS domain S-box-containing protein
MAMGFGFQTCHMADARLEIKIEMRTMKNSKLPLLPKGGVARNLVNLFLLFGIIPLGILALIFLYLYFNEKKLAVAEVQQEVAERIATGVSGHLERTKGKVELFAHLYDLMSMDTQKLRNTAYEILDQDLDYNELTIANIDGKEVCKVSRYYTFKNSELSNLPEDSLLIYEFSDQTRISKIQISNFNKLPEIHITVPITDSSEKTIGILDVGVNVARMWDLISKYRIGKNRYAYVVDAQGTLLAYRNISSVLAKADLNNIEAVKKLLGNEVGVFEYQGLEGSRVIGASAVIPLTGWAVIVEEPLAKAYMDLYFLSAASFAIFLITIASALILGLRFSFRNLVLPLRTLQEQAVAFAQGDFDHRIGMARRDELGQLSETFNKMAADIQKTTVSRDLLSIEIEQRKQVAEVLRETNEALEALILASPVAIIVLDADGHVKLWNPAAQSTFGWSEEEVIGRSLPYVTEDKLEEHKALRERVLRGEAFSEVEVRRIRKDGSPVDLSISTAPLRDARGEVTGIMSLNIDITARKRSEEEKRHLQAQLRQAHKMEAVGTLAGGIAHDFNNILAAMIGYTEIALIDVSQSSPKRHDLEQVLKAGHRAKDLVKQILVFSRMKQHEERTPVEIAPIIDEALKLLRASLPSTIEIRQNTEIETSTVLADPTEIHQLVVNLCTNAAHAMEESGGILEVGLTEAVIDPRAAGAPPDLGPGRYLRLSVSDTGHGIDAASLERIFDPYFTTKEVGKGSGLGLAVVHGIVKRHEGAITVNTDPGIGTRFHVYFPKLESMPVKEVDGVEIPLPKGTERILFVDDEEILVEMGNSMLQWLGYEVSATTSSLQALELFAAHPDGFDLVITDYTMPYMTGADLAEEMMRIRSDIPVILCTGFSDRITEEKARHMGIRAFAMKPLDMVSIAETVRRVLDNNRNRSST